MVLLQGPALTFLRILETENSLHSPQNRKNEVTFAVADPGFRRRGSANPRGTNLLLPPANEVREDHVFTGVRLSTGGVYSLHAGIHTPRQAPSLGRHSPGQIPPPAQCMLGYGQQAGGTHPAGMYSCLSKFLPKTAWN